MKKGIRILKWVLLGLGGLALLLLLLIGAADRYLSTERGAKWLYSDVEQPLDIRYTPNRVRYLQVGDTTKTPLLLLHGAPGGLFDWLAIAKRDTLYEEYYLLIPERPGYGGTLPKVAEPSVIQQAEALLPVLKQQKRPAVLMGHSYGAPVAVAMGALAPASVMHIFGLSGAYDPSLEIVFGISYWIDYPWARYLLPCPIWVSNVEKLHHAEALREAKPLFKQAAVPITLAHGTKDQLVPFGNSTYLRKLKPNKTELIPLPGQPHPVHVMLPDYLAQLLLGQRPPVPSSE